MSSTSAFQHTSYRICGIPDCASLGGNPGNPRKPPETLRKPLHVCTGNPYRVLTNLSGGRSAGTNPLAHSRPVSTESAVPSRCKIIRMVSEDKRENDARLLPCLCVPGVFSHRTSPGASTRKSNRNRILSDSDSFILVV